MQRSHAVVKRLLVRIETVYNFRYKVYYNKVLTERLSHGLGLFNAFISDSRCRISQVAMENLHVGPFVSFFPEVDRQLANKFDSRQTNSPLSILGQLRQYSFKLLVIYFGPANLSKLNVITNTIESNVRVVVFHKVIDNRYEPLICVVFTDKCAHLAKG